MTKEEKEAIEKLSNPHKKDLISMLRTFKKEGIENFAITRRRYIDTVLNLIQKQQVEIEKLNKDNKKLDKQAQEYFETIMFKDKVIDLMAEEIASYNRYESLGKLEEKENVKQYFEKKVEEK